MKVSVTENKELLDLVKELHKYNIVLSDYENNTIITPDKKLIFIDHDNFGIDDLIIDSENKFLR